MKITKKAIVIIVIVVVIILAIVFIGVYRHNHPTHYLYNDNWIIGKSVYEIEQRYGSYDFNSETIHGTLLKGYLVKRQSTDWWWGDVIWPEYYMIYFDEDGKAYKVDIFVDGRGG